MAGRLATELIVRGSATLAVPSCAICSRTGKPLFRGQGGGVCQRCRAWQLALACATCGKVRPPAGRNSAGQPVCEVAISSARPRSFRNKGLTIVKIHVESVVR